MLTAKQEMAIAYGTLLGTLLEKVYPKENERINVLLGMLAGVLCVYTEEEMIVFMDGVINTLNNKVYE